MPEKQEAGIVDRIRGYWSRSGTKIDNELQSLEEKVASEVNQAIEQTSKEQLLQQKQKDALKVLNKILSVWNEVLKTVEITIKNPDMKENFRRVELQLWEKIEVYFHLLANLREEDVSGITAVINPILDKLTFSKEELEDFPENRALYDLIAEYRNRPYKNGEVIQELEGEKAVAKIGPKGTIVQKGNCLLLNGWEIIYEGAFDEWFTHPKGFVIKSGNKYFLNGEKEIYEIIPKEFAGPDKIFESELGLIYYKYPGGDKVQIYIDGDLYSEEDCNQYFFTPHPKGILKGKYLKDNTFSYVLNNQQQYCISGSQEMHPFPGKIGIAFEKRKKVPTVLPNGKIIEEEKPYIFIGPEFSPQEIYSGDYKKMKYHPNGLIIVAENKIFFNDQLIYEGSYDDCMAYGDGVAVRKEEIWRMYKPKEKDNQ